MARVTKSGGKCLVTAPDKFATVFTNGSLSDTDKKVRLDCIDEELRKIEPSKSNTFEQISKALQDQSFINRATIALTKNKHYQIIRTEEQLAAIEPGAPIFRKLPGMVVANYYHQANEYQKNISNLSNVDKSSIVTHQDSFKNDEELAKYNRENPSKLLGKEYIGNNPFSIFLFSPKHEVSLVDVTKMN